MSHDRPSESASNLGPANASTGPETSDLLVAAVVELEDNQQLGSSNDTPIEKIRWRELLAVGCLVVLADLTIYRGAGYAGIAVLFAIAPILLWLGSQRSISMPGFAIVIAMLAALAGKLVWSGSPLLVACGFALFIAYSMTIAGQTPFVVDGIVFASQTIRAGLIGLYKYARCLARAGIPVTRVPWLNVLLPLLALVVFGAIFIFANPDLLSAVSQRAERVTVYLREWLMSLSLFETAFWGAVIWISVGLLKPFAKRRLQPIKEKRFAAQVSDEDIRAKIYPALRNTLVTVIFLFAAYLVLEFQTLWFREFPQGFYYAGYAHEGAAWLTLALALATIMLSVIFQGRILKDDRLPLLKKLSWLWSAQNFLLALAIYNRLLIYVDFNGMTRMRTIGFLGITCVVIGFVLVLYKLSRHRSFAWLIQRQMLTVAFAVYVYAVIPVDYLVHSYNVRQVLAGDLAPAVQIVWHPIADEGLLALTPLVECDDPVIREGVRAMLADRKLWLESRQSERRAAGWSAFQAADRFILGKLSASAEAWQDYAEDERRRDDVFQRFKDYAYQWY